MACRPPCLRFWLAHLRCRPSFEGSLDSCHGGACGAISVMRCCCLRCHRCDHYAASHHGAQPLIHVADCGVLLSCAGWATKELQSVRHPQAQARYTWPVMQGEVLSYRSPKPALAASSVADTGPGCAARMTNSPVRSPTAMATFKAPTCAMCFRRLPNGSSALAAVSASDPALAVVAAIVVAVAAAAGDGDAAAADAVVGCGGFGGCAGWAVSAV